MRWAEHVARMGERWEMRIKFCPENLKERDNLEDSGVDGTEVWNGP
jgi:hypothetical protein